MIISLIVGTAMIKIHKELQRSLQEGGAVSQPEVAAKIHLPFVIAVSIVKTGIQLHKRARIHQHSRHRPQEQAGEVAPRCPTCSGATAREVVERVEWLRAMRVGISVSC